MEIGFNLGLRVAELASLTVGHVRNRETVTIVGKGSKERILPLSKHLQRQIKDFIKRKLIWKESIHDDAPLFVSQMGGPMAIRTLQEMFEKRCIEAGLTNRGQGQGSSSQENRGKGQGSSSTVEHEERSSYTFHCMRHTCAMRLRERGYDIEQVAEWLGHSSLNSTRVYFRTSMEELVEMANSL